MRHGNSGWFREVQSEHPTVSGRFDRSFELTRDGFSLLVMGWTGARKAIVEADDWEGPSFQTCQSAASVCRAFETSRRREVLSFSHHAEVAALPPADADALLDWAEETIATTESRGQRGN